MPRKMGPRFSVGFRRQRERRTDYRRRLKLVKSGYPRLVVRLSNRHVHVHLSKASPVGDITLTSAHSSQLRGYGWKGATSNTPAAYLTGLLCGRRAVKSGHSKAVLDVGGHSPVKGSKLFAVLKGALDGGLEVPHDGGVLPDEKRTSGAHIAEHAARLKAESPEEYKRKFSSYLRREFPPEDIPQHFNAVKQNILSGECSG